MSVNEERLRQVMAAVFEVDESAIGPTASSETVSTWDSLNTLKLIMAIEAEFKVRYPEKDIAQATSWNRVVESLSRAGLQL